MTYIYGLMHEPILHEEQESPMTRTPLPTAIIPFILENLEGFSAVLENDERIIIMPKAGAVMAPTLQPTLKRGKPILRPKFVYKVRDRKLTPDQARTYGFSESRYRVYRAVFNADPKKGAQSKEILEQTGLPHGSVQQILHWLRKQKLITGEPEPEKG